MEPCKELEDHDFAILMVKLFSMDMTFIRSRAKFMLKCTKCGYEHELIVGVE